MTGQRLVIYFAFRTFEQRALVGLDVPYPSPQISSSNAPEFRTFAPGCGHHGKTSANKLPGTRTWRFRDLRDFASGRSFHGVCHEWMFVFIKQLLTMIYFSLELRGILPLLPS